MEENIEFERTIGGKNYKMIVPVSQIVDGEQYCNFNDLLLADYLMALTVLEDFPEFNQEVMHFLIHHSEMKPEELYETIYSLDLLWTSGIQKLDTTPEELPYKGFWNTFRIVMFKQFNKLRDTAIALQQEELPN